MSFEFRTEIRCWRCSSFIFWISCWCRIWGSKWKIPTNCKFPRKLSVFNWTVGSCLWCLMWRLRATSGDLKISIRLNIDPSWLGYLKNSFEIISTKFTTRPHHIARADGVNIRSSALENLTGFLVRSTWNWPVTLSLRSSNIRNYFMTWWQILSV